MDGILENFNDKDAQSTFNQADVQNNMIVAVLPYIIPILFFIPILADRNSSFCRFHANQQLTWFITLIIVGIITGIIGIIPILGAIIGALVGLCTLGVMIMYIIGAVKGMALRLPFIGNMINVF